MDFLIGLASNAWSVLLIVIFFEGSIFVHELGHYLAAVWRGAKVERFSIGMGKPIFLWKNRKGVEFCFAWLPFGGYVRLPQLADLGPLEGQVTSDVSQLPSLGIATKVIVFAAGATFNVIFAFLLATVIWIIGFPTDDTTSTTQIGNVAHTLKRADGSEVASPASRAGLQPGDVIVTIDGEPMHDWPSIQQALALGSGRTADGRERLVKFQLRRGGELLDVDVNPILGSEEKIRQVGIQPAWKVTFGKIPANTVAARVGLREGDRIVAVDTTPLFSPAQLQEYLKTHGAAPTSLKVLRGTETVSVALPPQTTANDLLRDVPLISSVRLIHENPFTQIRTIANSAFGFLRGLLNPRSDVGINEMSGPVGIVNQYWQVVNSEYAIRMTLYFTILINISLAIFNLLPIPVLDGGNIMFALIAKIRGRALPPDFINATQSVFVVLLFSMVMYTLFADVRRLVRSERAEAQVEPATAPTPTPAAAKP